jgi:hypothetical protein
MQLDSVTVRIPHIQQYIHIYIHTRTYIPCNQYSNIQTCGHPSTRFGPFFFFGDFQGGFQERKVLLRYTLYYDF